MTAPRRFGHPDRAGVVSTSAEENREKGIGADEETRTATRRRVGDRCYQNEVHDGKEGKRRERTTRRNGGDDDIERFKRESSEKRSNQPALKLGSADASPSPTAIAAASDGSADAGGLAKITEENQTIEVW
jgi:hypothetical protein